MPKGKPYDAEQAVNDYINTTNPPDNPNKQVPIPDEHGCTGDTCWCKHF